VVLWTLQGIVAFAVPPRVDRGVRQASGKLGDGWKVQDRRRKRWKLLAYAGATNARKPNLCRYWYLYRRFH
jgi:hypothetical protein